MKPSPSSSDRGNHLFPTDWFHALLAGFISQPRFNEAVSLSTPTVEQQLLETILNQLPNSILVFDALGNLLFLNTAADRLFSGQQWKNNAILWPLAQALHGETITGWKQRIDDSTVEILITAAPLLNEQQAIIGAILTCETITLRQELEQSLRESEKRFRELADAMPQLVWTARPDGIVDYYNQRYKEFQGIAPGDDGTWHWAPVVHPDDLQATVDAWEQAVRTHEVYEIGHRILQADGTFRWYLSRGVPATDAQGQVVKWYGTATDIQAQKQAEEEVTTILNSINDGLMVLNNDWIITYFNLAAERLLNFKVLDTLGHHFFDIFPAAKGTIFEEQYAWALRERQFTAFEARYESEPFENWYNVHVYPQAHGISVYFQVITERKQTEEILRESEKRFRQLADSMPQLVWTARADGIVDYVNQRLHEYSGFKRRPDGTWNWEDTVYADDLQETLTTWQHAVQTGNVFQAEQRMVRVDGSLRWHLSRAVAIHDDQERIVRWYGTSTDIHDRILIAERIAVLQEVTASLSRAATVSDVIGILMNKTLKAIGAHLGAIMMLTPDRTELVLVGMPQNELYQRVPLDSCMPVTDAARTGEPIWIETQDDFAVRYPAIVSSIVDESMCSHAVAAIPLIVDELVIGSFLVSFLRPVAFSQEQRDFMQALAQQYAQAINRAYLYEEVQQERDRLHTILDSMTEEVWFLDDERIVKPANTAAAVGALSTHPDRTSREDKDAPLWRSFITGEIIKQQDEFIRHLHTGELRYRQVSSAPVRAQSGEIVGAVGVVRDMTDQKRAEDRQHILQNLGAGLAKALTPADVAATVIEQGMKAVGTLTGIVAMLVDAGKTLEIIASTGYSPAVINGWRRFPVAASSALLAKAVRDRTPLFFGSVEEGMPLAPNAPVDNQQPGAIIPLMIQERVLGAVHFSFSMPRTFDETERRFLLSIADYCAQALERSLLAEQAKEAVALQERHRFARDLHDSVSQVLFASTTIAESMPRLWEHSSEKTLERLNKVAALNRAAMAEMRVLLLELRPESIAKTPLPNLLTQLVLAAKGHKSIETDLKIEVDEFNVDADVVTTFYRIAQESINNILKHSQATRLEVAFIQSAPQKFRLSITDNGTGFDPSSMSQCGLGLQFMRERAETISAKLNIESQAEAGTRITVEWHTP